MFSSQQESSVSNASETKLNEHEKATVTYTKSELNKFVEIKYQEMLEEARTKRDELLRMVDAMKFINCKECTDTPKCIQEESKKTIGE